MPPTPKQSLDVSQITDYLYISGWPRSHHTIDLQALNIRLILSMHWMRPHKSLGHPPQKLLWLPTFDNPLLPIPLATLQRGVEAALPVIQAGGSVLSHCHFGVHRSVAMACCVLIGMGYTAEAAMQQVRTHRAAADPDAWYIQNRIRRFEQDWLARIANQTRG
ncbi:MAG TPA: dual specificity protein phosphatase [Anaerolineales bacterium]|jgi:protein-tyrosine phosphatase|nr:dual specificity protein phosphatase [Anaerolineales bacterium]